MDIISILGLIILLAVVGGLCYLVYQLIVLYIIPAVLWVLNALPYMYAAAIVIPVICSALIAIGCYIKNLIDSIDYVKREIKRIPPEQREPAIRVYDLSPRLSGLKLSVQNSYNAVKNVIESLASFGVNILHFDDCPPIIYFILKSFGKAWELGSRAGGIISYLFVTLIVLFIHVPFYLVGQLVFWMTYGFVSKLDYWYLKIKRIKSDCPNCHERYTIPAFKCPSCHEMHFELVPNNYGIFHHECRCGQELPSTFLSGRSRLEACCPKCVANMVSSDSRPIAIQLIGGTASGKTIYMSAFFELFKEIIQRNNSLIVDESNKSDFCRLSAYYNGRDCDSTSQKNSKMYPIVINNKDDDSKRLFYIYDIAGEMFDGNTANNQTLQKQFEYCDGFLLFIDPYSSESSRQNSDSNQTVFSSIPLDRVIENFENYLIHFSMKEPDEMSPIPLSVIIGKMDVESSGEKLISDCNALSYEERDELCKEFLRNNGLSRIINQLETNFTDIHYFPVSSIGHSPDGTKFEPRGVLEPIEAILEKVDHDLYEQLKNRVVSNNLGD